MGQRRGMKVMAGVARGSEHGAEWARMTFGAAGCCLHGSTAPPGVGGDDAAMVQMVARNEQK